MATSSAWLSILVKRGQDIVKPRTVVKCSWEETFGALLIDYIFPSPADHVRPYVQYSSARTVRVNVFLAKRVSLRRRRAKRRGEISFYFAVKVSNIYDNDLKIIKQTFSHDRYHKTWQGSGYCASSHLCEAV